MKTIVLIIGISLVLMSCASVPRYHSGSPRRTVRTKPAIKKEIPGSEVPLMTIKRNKSAILMSSYYGPKFHGRPTASGEIFNMYGETAAHKEMPLGTIINVTYLKTGKSVVVKVNDRGPFIPGRDLDLSYGAAKKIGLLAEGVGKVKITVLKWGGEN